ncbi:hypothetical protein OAE99_00525 [bacterium]|nr:hypothetical protein [bacterium]
MSKLDEDKVFKVLERLFEREQPIDEMWDDDMDDDIHSVTPSGFYTFGLMKLGDLIILRATILDGVSETIFDWFDGEQAFHKYLKEENERRFLEAEISKLTNIPDDTKEFGEGVTADEVWEFIWQHEEYLGAFLRGEL